ncbi:MAG: hypothetical protein ACSHX8_02455 [Opitutaceae bacterium]
MKLFNAIALAAVFAATSLTTSAAQPGSEAERIARLEQRLLELEARLANTEQETKEVKVLASSAAATGGNASILGNQATFDILANSAWRNLRWTQAEQWEGIVRGISEEKVVELLGHPPRSVKSVKPRVDLVYYYETSIRDRSNTMRGKISFKKGVVISVQKPLFKAQN